MTASSTQAPTSLKQDWGRSPVGGCVYALSFSDDAVKIGKTIHLRQRLGRHLSESRRFFGARLKDFYFTRTHIGYSTTEDLAIMAAESLMTEETQRPTREWFIGIDFGALTDLLTELDPTDSYTQPPAHGRAA